MGTSFARCPRYRGGRPAGAAAYTSHMPSDSSTHDQLDGVMLNAYPDSIGETLSDVMGVLELPQFADVFSLFYVLPTFFNSDLDRGFSVIDYNLNEELVSPAGSRWADELSSASNSTWCSTISR